MLRSKNYSNLLNITYVALGAILLTWGLSFFLKPLCLIIVGVILIRHGLMSSGLPMVYYFQRFMNFR